MIAIVIIGLLLGGLIYFAGFQMGIRHEKNRPMSLGERVWYDEVERAKKTLEDVLPPWCAGGYTIDTLADWTARLLLRANGGKRPTDVVRAFDED